MYLPYFLIKLKDLSSYAEINPNPNPNPYAALHL